MKLWFMLLNCNLNADRRVNIELELVYHALEALRKSSWDVHMCTRTHDREAILHMFWPDPTYHTPQTVNGFALFHFGSLCSVIQWFHFPAAAQEAQGCFPTSFIVSRKSLISPLSEWEGHYQSTLSKVSVQLYCLSCQVYYFHYMEFVCPAPQFWHSLKSLRAMS